MYFGGTLYVTEPYDPERFQIFLELSLRTMVESKDFSTQVVAAYLDCDDEVTKGKVDKFLEFDYVDVRVPSAPVKIYEGRSPKDALEAYLEFKMLQLRRKQERERER